MILYVVYLGFIIQKASCFHSHWCRSSCNLNLITKKLRVQYLISNSNDYDILRHFSSLCGICLKSKCLCCINIVIITLCGQLASTMEGGKWTVAEINTAHLDTAIIRSRHNFVLPCEAYWCYTPEERTQRITYSLLVLIFFPTVYYKP